MEKTVAVIGGSGFIGRAIVEKLTGEGARVIVLCRNAEKAKYLKTMGVVGQVTIVAGNALNWEYAVVLEMSGSEVKVHFDDWIYRQDEDVAINRAFISKFGIEIGSVTIVFLRGRTAAAVGPLDLENWPR